MLVHDSMGSGFLVKYILVLYMNYPVSESDVLVGLLGRFYGIFR